MIRDEARWESARRAALARDSYCCTECGNADVTSLDVHHLVPRGAGGSDEPNNLIVLCDGCHSARHPNLHAGLLKRVFHRWIGRLAGLLMRDRELAGRLSQLDEALRVLGKQKFRAGQLPVVLAALRGESVLVVFPTGTGKSLCFQLPALLHNGTTYVLTPTKALMADQVAGLHRRKVPATFVNSDLSRDEREAREAWLGAGAVKLLYVTPEAFLSPLVREERRSRLKAPRVGYVVVDEAHLVDRWGDAFRPSYSELPKVAEYLGKAPVLAFTATAGPEVREQLRSQFNIKSENVFLADPDRPNLSLIRIYDHKEDEKVASIARILEDDEKTMIFVPTRKIGTSLRAKLEARSIKTEFYSAQDGTPYDRELILGRFRGDLEPRTRVLIGTSALGMGIDIPDITQVIHWQHPASVEDYLQEYGRAGRAGAPGRAILFVGPGDVGLLEYMVRKNTEDKDVQAKKYAAIDVIRRLANNRDACFRDALMKYLDPPPVTASWGQKLLEWRYVEKSRRAASVPCCDHCEPGLSELLVPDSYASQTAR